MGFPEVGKRCQKMGSFPPKFIIKVDMIASFSNQKRVACSTDQSNFHFLYPPPPPSGVSHDNASCAILNVCDFSWSESHTFCYSFKLSSNLTQWLVYSYLEANFLLNSCQCASLDVLHYVNSTKSFLCVDSVFFF